MSTSSDFLFDLVKPILSSLLKESLLLLKIFHQASLVAQMVKSPPAMQETEVRSLGQEDPPGEGHGNPLQYSCLENPMDRETWQATAHGVTKRWTRLSD